MAKKVRRPVTTLRQIEDGVFSFSFYLKLDKVKKYFCNILRSLDLILWRICKAVFRPRYCIVEYFETPVDCLCLFVFFELWFYLIVCEWCLKALRVLRILYTWRDTSYPSPLRNVLGCDNRFDYNWFISMYTKCSEFLESFNKNFSIFSFLFFP